MARTCSDRWLHQHQPECQKEQEAGVKTADVCRTHGISSATFYKWRPG